MKKFKSTLFVCGLLVLTNSVLGQDSLAKENYTPYELITNYYDNGFAPFAKKNWFVGLSFSLTDQALQNSNRLFEKVVQGDDVQYDLTLKGGRYIGDYVMVGANLIYERKEFKGFVVNQDSDTLQRNSLGSGGEFKPFLKTYFPLSKNERLSFFNELGVGFGFGNKLTRETKKVDQVTKEFSNYRSFSIGLSPGITFFAIENFAFEIQINDLIGYQVRNVETTVDDSVVSKDTSHNVNFQIDLLSLNLGLAYYFTKNKKK